MILINLFSVFDPTSYFNLPLNWFIVVVLYIFINLSYYFIKRRYQWRFKKLIDFILNRFKEVSGNNYYIIVFVSIVSFVYLIFCNLLGLFPYIFTGTAHVYITLGLGLVFWIRFFLIGFIKNFKNRVAHLVPEGSPLLLSPLIVLIESISHLIRPFTLSIRLAANIMAGHLIIGLISRIRLLRILGAVRSLILQGILLVLEFGVSLIQGFVFRILLILYALEYY